MITKYAINSTRRWQNQHHSNNFAHYRPAGHDRIQDPGISGNTNVYDSSVQSRYSNHGIGNVRHIRLNNIYRNTAYYGPDETNILAIVTMKDGIKYIHTTGEGCKNKGNFNPILK